MPRFLIMAGEASGDLHGANLALALRAKCPDAEIEGLGGPRMREAGVGLLSGIDKLDIIGIPSLPELLRAISVFRKLSAYIAASRFDVVIFIDNPGLNLRLARVAKAAGHRVVYYVAPQIWAWNERRIHAMRRNVDLLLALLPFEEAYFKKGGVNCRFVGHPIMDDLASDYDVPALRREFGLDSQAQIVGLLPGSRVSEVTRLLPPMLDAAALLAADAAKAGIARQFVLAHAPSVPITLVRSMIDTAGVPVHIVSDRASEVMAASDALAVTSGTATLQTALVGRPMVIVYRTSALSAAVFRHLIKVPWIGLANLVAGRTIATELIQEKVSGLAIRDELALILDPGRKAEAEALGRDLCARFGTAKVADRVADEVLGYLRTQENAPGNPKFVVSA